MSPGFRVAALFRAVLRDDKAVGARELARLKGLGALAVLRGDEQKIVVADLNGLVADGVEGDADQGDVRRPGRSRAPV